MSKPRYVFNKINYYSHFHFISTTVPIGLIIGCILGPLTFITLIVIIILLCIGLRQHQGGCQNQGNQADGQNEHDEPDGQNPGDGQNQADGDQNQAGGQNQANRL